MVTWQVVAAGMLVVQETLPVAGFVEMATGTILIAPRGVLLDALHSALLDDFSAWIAVPAEDYPPACDEKFFGWLRITCFAPFFDVN